MDQPEALLRLVLKWPARGKCSQRNEEWIYPDYPMLQESIPGRIGFSFAFFLDDRRLCCCCCAQRAA
jgi:hypothetical protein